MSETAGDRKARGASEDERIKAAAAAAAASGQGSDEDSRLAEADSEVVDSAKAPFTMEIDVEPDDIDFMNHVYNLVYMRWVLDVARAHSEACGFDEAAYAELGQQFIVRRHEIDYLRSAVLGDRIRLTTWIESWRGARSYRRTRIEKVAPGKDPVVLARAMTQWVLIDLESGRPRRIRPELVEAFRQKKPEIASGRYQRPKPRADGAD